jgi:alginate O-acetyltransferase complex protein AlgI
MFNGAAAGINPNFFSAWVGVIAYTMQIYFDFSGYCDMALGISMLFGIRLPLNFDSPYQATSIVDFWRRWHMTLSRLLRDYVYIPLGGNRHGTLRRYFNLSATMLIGGIWHGASWNFLIWGGLHGAYLVVNHLWARFNTRGIRLGAFGALLTMLAVVFAWIPFRADTLSTSVNILGTMIGHHGLSLPVEIHQIVHRLGVDLSSLGIASVSENRRKEYYIAMAVLGIAIGIALLVPNAVRMAKFYRPAADLAQAPANVRTVGLPTFRPNLRWGAIVGLLLVAALCAINSARPSEFLYFQF